MTDNIRISAIGNDYFSRDIASAKKKREKASQLEKTTKETFQVLLIPPVEKNSEALESKTLDSRYNSDSSESIPLLQTQTGIEYLQEMNQMQPKVLQETVTKAYEKNAKPLDSITDDLYI